MPNMEPLAFWDILLDLLVLVIGALILGGLAERLRQSAILGYLLAGTLLGPHALNLIPNQAALEPLAEIGVALLLFTIGLEFSWSRLRRFGTRLFGGGIIQIVVTGTFGAGALAYGGFDWPQAIALGAMVSLSSTAAVLRLLYARSELDSLHGRNALGILLVQDLAVIPFVFLITVLGGSNAFPESGWSAARGVGIAILGIALFFVIIRFLIPRLLRTEEVARNRDLGILLAVTSVTGAAWGSHAIGLSPALGAFVAGMILGDCPFATQIRSDIVPFRTLFVTLFFSSVGTQANLGWALNNAGLVLLLVAFIIFGKSLLTTIALTTVRNSFAVSLATGVCLAQVGEFSFVIGQIALGAGVLDKELYSAALTITTATLFFTPFLVGIAPWLSSNLSRLPRGTVRVHAPEGESLKGHIVIVGYGPAGQRVASDVIESGLRVMVVDQNAGSLALAREHGVSAAYGDARSGEVLDHLFVDDSAAVVVTVPDPDVARQIIERVRSRSPELPIVARSRYHAHRWQLRMAGARDVVDEEEEVGRRTAEQVLAILQESS